MQVVAQGVVGNHHPLRTTAGAGGIDHIRQMARRKPCDQRSIGGPMQPLRRIHIDQDGVCVLQQIARCRMDDERTRCAVGQHVSQTLGRITRIQRNIGTACLQDRKQRHHQFGAALHAQGDALVRPNPKCNQVMRKLIRPCIELGIGQAQVTKGHCYRIRCPLYLRLEHRRQRRHRHLRFPAATPGIQACQLIGGT